MIVLVGRNCQRARFELEISGNDGDYKYELVIEHNSNKSCVKYERLWFDNQPLLKFELGEVQLFRDNYSPRATYSFDWSQSLLPSLIPKGDNTKLTWFKERMKRFIIVKIIPSLMVNGSAYEETRLSLHMENFVSWYRYLSQEQGKVALINEYFKRSLGRIFQFYFKTRTQGKKSSVIIPNLKSQIQNLKSKIKKASAFTQKLEYYQ